MTFSDKDIIFIDDTPKNHKGAPPIVIDLDNCMEVESDMFNPDSLFCTSPINSIRQNTRKKSKFIDLENEFEDNPDPSSQSSLIDRFSNNHISDEELNLAISNRIKRKGQSAPFEQLDMDQDSALNSFPVDGIKTDEYKFNAAFTSKRDLFSSKKGLSLRPNLLSSDSDDELILVNSKSNIVHSDTKSSEVKRAIKKEVEVQKMLVEVNKLKNMREATKDIIVELTNGWEEINEKNELFDSLKELGSQVQFSKFSEKKAIRWIRNIESDYDFGQNLWIPCSRRQEYEPYILFLISGESIATMINDKKLHQFYIELKSEFRFYKIIMVINDLEVYYKKRLKTKKRLADERIKEQQTGKKARAIPEYFTNGPNERQIVTCLTKLSIQAEGNLKIFPIVSKDLSMWISSITRHIAQYPRVYTASEIHNSLTFGGTIKAGKNPSECWSRMLNLIPGVTQKYSDAITAKYPTILSFRNAVKITSNPIDVLTGIELGDGKKIGTTISKRIVETLVDLNPNTRIL